MREEVKCRRVVSELFALFRPRWRERGERFFTLRWSTGRQSFIEGNRMRITNEQQVGFTVEPKTAAGNAAPIDGEIEVSSSDEAVCTVEKTGPNAGLVKAVGPGVAQIFASFDADLGEGVRAVEMSGAIEVVQAEAETAEIVFGTPELKPAG